MKFSHLIFLATFIIYQGCHVVTDPPTPDETIDFDCSKAASDVLKGSVWGADEHGHQLIRFREMAPDEDSLTIGTFATSHFTTDFEEDGFDFAYFIECEYDNGDYALIMADYYNAWVDGDEPNAGVIEENIEYYYPRFRLSATDGGDCLFFQETNGRYGLAQTKEERQNNTNDTENKCWPRATD